MSFPENFFVRKTRSQRPSTSTFRLLAPGFLHLLLQVETAVPTEMDRNFWCKSPV